MELPELPAELLLNLAELMDIVSLKRLMATNKALSDLIQTYEKSISLTKMATFKFLPTGNILSSLEPERFVLRPETFDFVRELECREQHIDRLFRTTSFLDIASPPFLRALTSPQQDRLLPLLRRALYHCDCMADLASNPPCKPIPEVSYSMIEHGTWARPAEEVNPENPRDGDPFANPQARPHQMAYIHSLPAHDVAFLYYLITALGVSYNNTRRDYVESDPSAWERITVFEESVLRHGTWFLWAYFLGPKYMKDMSSEMEAAGMVELTDWETGKEGMQPGLKMTLLDRFKEVFVDEDDDDDDMEGRTFLKDRMLEFVKDIVNPGEENGGGSAAVDSVAEGDGDKSSRVEDDDARSDWEDEDEGNPDEIPEHIPQPSYANKSSPTTTAAARSEKLKQFARETMKPYKELLEAFTKFICPRTETGAHEGANNSAQVRAVSSAAGLDYASNTARTPSRALAMPFLRPQVSACSVSASEWEPTENLVNMEGELHRLVYSTTRGTTESIKPPVAPMERASGSLHDRRHAYAAGSGGVGADESPRKHCVFTSTASLSPSMSMTNPELIWAQVQEKKQRESMKQDRLNRQVQSSAASTYSELTTYSFDKDQTRNAPKLRRSLRDRVKDAFRDGGRPSTTT
ncbi:hypothetical protein DL769_000828 [Monosporascus sp. CRB-8-3]|nr:hypothetical protein DL769_000828 [Monosporascus sp. CRB-8-3]